MAAGATRSACLVSPLQDLTVLLLAEHIFAARRQHLSCVVVPTVLAVARAWTTAGNSAADLARGAAGTRVGSLADLLLPPLVQP